MNASEKDTETADAPAAQEEAASGNDNGKMSSKSSDISIEEIGPEDEAADVVKAEDAEELIPEIVREPLGPPMPETDEDDDDDEDDDLDETLWERLVGLTEMFPPGLTGFVDGEKECVNHAVTHYPIVLFFPRYHQQNRHRHQMELLYREVAIMDNFQFGEHHVFANYDRDRTTRNRGGSKATATSNIVGTRRSHVWRKRTSQCAPSNRSRVAEQSAFTQTFFVFPYLFVILHDPFFVF